MLLVIAGVAIGLAIALAAGRLVASLLFGLAATDTVTMLLAMTVMVLVSAIAEFLREHRASICSWRCTTNRRLVWQNLTSVVYCACGMAHGYRRPHP